MNLVLIGQGRMGSMLWELAEAAGHTALARVDVDDLDTLAALPRGDVALDFSGPGALEQAAAYVRRTGTPYLSGVTAYTPQDMDALKELAAYAPILYSANYSLGIAVCKRLLQILSTTPLADWDIEVTETHHNRKADAPSGTAKLLLQALDPDHALTPVYGREGLCGPRKSGEVGIHALRGGTVAGTHTVHFFGTDEELEITHRAASRQIFASGAYHVARLLPAMPAGVYDLQDILFGK